MNKISVAISARKTRPGEVSNFSRAHVAIDLTVSIDGVALGDTSDEADNGVVLDGYALLATVRSMHPQYFFTCGCGEAGCAGIFQEVVVSRSGSVVEWIFSRRLSLPTQVPRLRSRRFHIRPGRLPRSTAEGC
jgi:hypothetical protein